MKSCIALIWDEKFSPVPGFRLLTGEISVTEIIFVSFEHNFCLYYTKSASQRECLPGKRESISPYE